MDLNQMKDAEQRQKIVSAINTAGAGSSPNAVFDPSRVMDDNSTDTFIAYSLYANPKAAEISEKNFSVGVSDLVVNGVVVNLKQNLTGFDLTIPDLPYFLQLEDKNQKTFFSGNMVDVAATRLRFQPFNLLYPIDIVKSQNLTSTSGKVTNVTVNQNTIQMVVTQDSQPFVSSDVGIQVPLVPFQNRLVV